MQCRKMYCLSSLWRRLVKSWTKLYSTLLWLHNQYRYFPNVYLRCLPNYHFRQKIQISGEDRDKNAAQNSQKQAVASHKVIFFDGGSQTPPPVGSGTFSPKQASWVCPSSPRISFRFTPLWVALCIAVNGYVLYCWCTVEVYITDY